ncbi:MAG: adenylyltransferase/cytidyltransferase family protein [Spirochaetales bacterium]|nr:adenylyltransferase/cytidyltransferase family protein [Spirochaetales bacterium]
MIKRGMIHGRFQPFHNGHFDYMKQALQLSEELIIGITNPDPGTIEEVGSDSHRHREDANPFNYYNRMLMIKRSILLNKQIAADYPRISIIPFPINKPGLWKYYVPDNTITQIIRVLDPWDNEKMKVFKEYGFAVKVIEGERITSGTEIREHILRKESILKHLVPAGTFSVLEELFQSS